ncbi:YdbH domain-containing protein [Alkalimarinus coralli]|uniref:YdbH domain-containing protein n=1 Tax=Alkalimarinus coralli TaxID=2935863 RepID=UPI00202B25AC|nr:YdbH domain-containing protein [Alkalimarinus coralli]
MKRWAIAAPLLLIIALLTALLTSWYTLPYWLPQALNAIVAPYHYQLERWAYSRPSLSGWNIQHVDLYKIPKTKQSHKATHENPVLVAKINNVSMGYSLESIIRREVEQVEIDSIEWFHPSYHQSSKSTPATLSTTQVHHFFKNFEHLKGAPSLSIKSIKIIETSDEHPNITTDRDSLLLNQASLTMTASKNAVDISLVSKIKTLDLNLTATFGDEHVISAAIKDQHEVTSSATIKLHSTEEKLDSSGRFAVDLSHIRHLPIVADLAFIKQFQKEGSSLKGVWSGNWQGNFNSVIELPRLTLTSEQGLEVELSLNHNRVTTRQSLLVELANQQLKTTFSPSQAYLEGSPLIKKKLTEWLKPPDDRTFEPSMVLTISQPVVASTPIAAASNMKIASSILSPVSFSFSNGHKKQTQLSGTGRLSLKQLKPLKAALDVTGSVGSFYRPWPKHSDISLSAEVSNKNDAWVVSLLQPMRLSWADWAIKDTTSEERTQVGLPHGHLLLSISDAMTLDTPIHASGKLTLNTEPFVAATQLPAMELTSPWSITDGVIELSNWHIQWEKMVATGQMTITPSDQTGTLKWQAHLPNAYEWLTQYSPNIPDPLTLKGGTFDTEGQLALLGDGKFSAAIHSNAYNWSGAWNEMFFEGLSVLSDTDITEDMTVTGTNAVATIDYFDPGFPIEEIKSHFTWAIGDFDLALLQLNITDLSATLLSGTVSSSAPFVIQPSNIDTSVNMNVRGVSLKDLLALEKETVTGEGTIDGSIPLEFHNSDVVVNNGYLSARPPGGWIKFKQSDAFKSMARNNENLLLAFSTLEDFHYQKLESNVDYQTNGDLLLGVSLAGKNPNFRQGQAFDFNINIENNLKALFKSLQLSEDINKRISERYQ